MNIALALACLLSLLVGASLQQNCDYYQEVVPGKEYYIYLPAGYTQGTPCQWRAIAPQNSKIKLNCFKFSVPQSPGCTQERMTVYLTADNSPGGARVYCGNGAFNVTSFGNAMQITYNSPYYINRQASFTCSLTTDNYIPPGGGGTSPPNPDCDCGWKKETRIVGGHETGVNEYPMMAGLVDFLQRMVFCGATIIARRYAVTAAHCLVKHPMDRTGLLVGDHDYSTGTDTNSTVLHRLIQYIVHPQYNTVTQENDIALVKTEKNIKFSLEVGPVCLPFRYTSYSFAGEKVTDLGWGTTEYSGPLASKLQGVVLEVIKQTACRAAYNNTINDNQICTYAKDKDACQSDSGGPVLWHNKPKDREFLCGIISYGIHCATDYPGVNTRVSAFLSFIIDNTPDATYCVM